MVLELDLATQCVGVVYGSVWLVGKLQLVHGGREDGTDVVLNQPLKTFHDHRSAVLGNSGPLEAGWDHDSARERLNIMVNTGASWLTQILAVAFLINCTQIIARLKSYILHLQLVRMFGILIK